MKTVYIKIETKVFALDLTPLQLTNLVSFLNSNCIIPILV